MVAGDAVTVDLDQVVARTTGAHLQFKELLDGRPSRNFNPLGETAAIVVDVVDRDLSGSCHELVPFVPVVIYATKCGINLSIKRLNQHDSFPSTYYTLQLILLYVCHVDRVGRQWADLCSV